jgi:hypothetical protein
MKNDLLTAVADPAGLRLSAAHSAVLGVGLATSPRALPIPLAGSE